MGKKLSAWNLLSIKMYTKRMEVICHCEHGVALKVVNVLAGGTKEFNSSEHMLEFSYWVITPHPSTVAYRNLPVVLSFSRSLSLRESSRLGQIRRCAIDALAVGIIISVMTLFLKVGSTATNNGSGAIQAILERPGITRDRRRRRDSVGLQESVFHASPA